MNFEEIAVKIKDETVPARKSSRAVKSCGESETLRINLKQCSFHQSHCDCRYKLAPRNLCVDYSEVPSLRVLSKDAISAQFHVQSEQPEVTKHQTPSSENPSWALGNLINEVPSENKTDDLENLDMELSSSLEKLSGSPEPLDNEGRRVVNMMCNIKAREEGPELLMTILVRMDDKMNRQLSCVVDETDTPYDLANELVDHGFIHEADRDKLASLIEESIYNKLNSVSRSSPTIDSTEDVSGTGTGIMFYPVPATTVAIDTVSVS